MTPEVFANEKGCALLAAIDAEKALTPEIDAKLQEFITTFKSRLKK